jgi:hypothetical protein
MIYEFDLLHFDRNVKTNESCNNNKCKHHRNLFLDGRPSGDQLIGVISSPEKYLERLQNWNPSMRAAK